MEKKHSKKRPMHIAIDQRSGPTLTQVVRRNPTVSYVESTSSAPTKSAPSSITFSNTNSNNSGGGMGKPVHIVSKII